VSSVWDEQTLLLRAGTAGNGADIVDVRPEAVGLLYVGLRVLCLRAGERRELATSDREVAVLPLAGSCDVDAAGASMHLEGRESVFHAVTDFAYLPIECAATISSHAGGEFAVISARATKRLEPLYVPAESVEIEVRGAGRATRQINNFLAPDAPWPTDKLIGVEVLTPGGNFSSYPPHKHDVADPVTGEADAEEIYYFRFSGDNGYGLYRQYAADGEFDVTAVVRDHDVFLVPRGYHGPSAAVPGHHMYFLNVLAGPAEERTMQYVDDPDQHWIRASWADQELDARVPLTGVAARSDGR
jgi:5-deoxy-glucuronate isomerase